ncbi:T9SS type A sorting domain-containing protein [candidate division KSB1 bacterium]|nr:T9SS type A sorting domain-containing protein [candidate division KSB1 bacterium]
MHKVNFHSLLNDNSLKTVFILNLIGALFCSLFAQEILLVDFGSNSASNKFGLTGWNTIIKSPKVNYTSSGPGGLVSVAGEEEFDDYEGIKGSSRKFQVGERIVVTWYNISDESYFMASRISFTDQDNPNEDGSGGKWYTMRSFDDYRCTYAEIKPHSSLKTAFNIRDRGIHKTDEVYSLININLHLEWYATYPKPYIICDKIELYNDADIKAPDSATNLAATVISDSKIELSWSALKDNVGVVEYLVYCNGEVEGYSRSNNYTAKFLEPATEYSFSVTALDKCRNESSHSNPVKKATFKYQGNSKLIDPGQFEYIGAIRLPEGFSYGGEALAYNPDGDGGQTGNGSKDGFAGSLFMTDLNQVQQGFVGEVSIPAPIKSSSKNLDELNEVTILQQPANIRPANVNSWDFVDIWRTGLEYIQEEKRLYSSWSIHYTVTGEKHASISCCTASNLATSEKYGAWYVGKASQFPIDAMANDYLFQIPQNWADTYTAGKALITGRCRDGGLSGLGPTLYAINLFKSTTPPAPNQELAMTTILEYGTVEGTDNYHYPNSIDDYNHADFWRDADWISYNSQAAVMLIGNKAHGNNWYGYQGENMLHDWIIADLPYPDSAFWETDPYGKGWRGQSYMPMAIFYAPSLLAAVAGGQSESFVPQPYTVIRFDKKIFWGTRQEITSAGYDEINHRLYVTEYNAPAYGRLLVHVWKLNAAPTAVKNEKAPEFDYHLGQNYPNPFNPSTIISYHLNKAGHITLQVFDIRGQEIATLVNEYKEAGSYQVIFDIQSKNLGSGIYFYILTSGNFCQSHKMLVVK